MYLKCYVWCYRGLMNIIWKCKHRNSVLYLFFLSFFTFFVQFCSLHVSICSGTVFLCQSIDPVKMHFKSSKLGARNMSTYPSCVRLHSTFIGDSDNVSLMTMCFYLIVLLIPGLIMMRQVIHLPTFQPPVDDVSSFFALSSVKVFYCW